MKTTSALLSLITSLSAAAVAAGLTDGHICWGPGTGSDCNVEGNLFQLEAWQTYNGSGRVGQVEVTQIGEMGTDTLAHFSAYPEPETDVAMFYINKGNNRLILLDPFTYLQASNAYTDKPEGGQLKFTFFNDTSRPEPYNWPVFGITDDDRLTVDGKSDVFSHCPTEPDSALITGPIVIGPGGEGCVPLDYLGVQRVSSQISQE